MKHGVISTTIVALGVIISPLSANATDLFGKSDQHPAPPEYTATDYFKGWYLGLEGGGQFTSISLFEGAFDGVSADGLVGGAHAGYDFAISKSNRVGVYVEGGVSDVATQINVPLFAVGDVAKQDWYAQAGIRAGHVFGNSTLAYVKAGYEWQRWSSDFSTTDVDVQAFAFGGGLETMITENMSFGVDATYLLLNEADFGDTDVSGFLEDSEALRILGRITFRQ